MKKAFSILVVLFLMISSTCYATSGDVSYFLKASESMSIAAQFKDRVIAIGEKDSFTEMDLELCLRYTDIWANLMNVALIEVEAASSDTPSDTYKFDEIVDMVNKMRAMLDLGIITKDVVITSLAEALKNNA